MLSPPRLLSARSLSRARRRRRRRFFAVARRRARSRHDWSRRRMVPLMTGFARAQRQAVGTSSAPSRRLAWLAAPPSATLGRRPRGAERAVTAMFGARVGARLAGSTRCSSRAPSRASAGARRWCPNMRQGRRRRRRLAARPAAGAAAPAPRRPRCSRRPSRSARAAPPPRGHRHRLRARVGHVWHRRRRGGHSVALPAHRHAALRARHDAHVDGAAVDRERASRTRASATSCPPPRCRCARAATGSLRRRAARRSRRRGAAPAALRRPHRRDGRAEALVAARQVRRGWFLIRNVSPTLALGAPTDRACSRARSAHRSGGLESARWARGARRLHPPPTPPPKRRGLCIAASISAAPPPPPPTP